MLSMATLRECCGDIQCIVGTDFGQRLGRSQSLWAARERGGLTGGGSAEKRQDPDMFGFVG